MDILPISKGKKKKKERLSDGNFYEGIKQQSHFIQILTEPHWISDVTAANSVQVVSQYDTVTE